MVGKGLEAATGDCKFPYVRKTYWRSATWNSHSAPPSPRLQSSPPDDIGGGGGGEGGTEQLFSTDASAPLTPRTQQQSNKVRAPLPPLQPLAIARKIFDEWPRAGLDDLTDWTTPATPGRRRVKTGPDIKLDLASVQRAAVEPTEIQLKRDKFALFDKQCSRVANYHIYLGSDAVARDRDVLLANGITHVLNCVGFVCPEYFKRDFVYKTLWLQDSPCEDITSLLYDVFDYFEEVREQGGCVFVHCCQGVSRSTSLVIAYLMWREHRSFEDAFQDVKKARGITNPNMGFACQLLQCQKRVHATPMSPDSVLRMYRLAPHSPYDPLHLVPKAVNNPGAAALDSRGAFVLHVPRAIFVWIGKECDPKMALAAKGAAGQVVRYERAEGPVVILSEGQEDPEFWISLSKYSAPSIQCTTKKELNSFGSESSSQEERETETSAELEVERVRKLSVGNRKVSSYDIDFQLYQRARQGGVLPPVPFTGLGVATVPTRLPVREDGWSVLRRKFLLGELVPTKETGSLAHSNLSPDTSMSSSSPHFSPFSATSGSSAGHASSESPFSSPVSLSDSLSPDTVQADSPDFIVPDCSISDISSPPVKNLPNTSAFKSFIPRFACQSPSYSLAERRGSIPPALRLPGLEDEPPPAPRGMSRKPRLPPLILLEKSRVGKAAEGSENSGLGELWNKELVAEAHEQKPGNSNNQSICIEVNDLAATNLPPSETLALQSGEVLEDSSADESVKWQESNVPDRAVEVNATDAQIQGNQPREGSSTLPDVQHMDSCKIVPEKHSALYTWPGLRRIEIFGVDDLDTRAAFLLYASHSNSIEGVVYVWVGQEFTAGKEQQSPNDNSSAEGLTWEQVGQLFLQQMHLKRETPIKILTEGQELEEFWENFKHG